MTFDNKAYLEQYPLSNEDQELIDLANRGKVAALTRYLSSCLIAVGKLSVEKVGQHKDTRLGLQRYYMGKISALISLIKDKEQRSLLTQIFIGE
jgi:hypothetical protein